MRIVHKRTGETPLQCLRRIFPDDGVKRTYAGRLDPMAEGLLLILEGEECREAKKYFALDKTYEYSFALGIATDTYDCLGRITACADAGEDRSSAVRKAVESLTGEVTLPYPPYSSKTVDGVPLFEHARGTGEVPAPERTVRIHTHTLTGSRSLSAAALAQDAISRIRTVRGDFRQEESIGDWETVPSMVLPVFSATLRGSGGVYVRAVVNEIGRRIGVPAVTVSIRRTGIGEWNHGQYPSASG